jgi:glycosyltransferase
VKISVVTAVYNRAATIGAAMQSVQSQTGAEIDGVYGDLDCVSAQDTSRIVRHWRSGAYRPGKLKRGWMPPHPTVYLRREVFETHGLYDTSMQVSADYDAMLRYLLRGGINVAYIPDVLVKMRTGGASNRSLSNLIQKSREDFRAIRRNRAGGVGTLFMKNASKLGQFIPKG